MSDRRSSRASSSTGSSSSFSPTISGFYGADAETAKDVVMLVNDVRQVGGESVYKPFIRLLKDCAAKRFVSPSAFEPYSRYLARQEPSPRGSRVLCQNDAEKSCQQ